MVDFSGLKKMMFCRGLEIIKARGISRTDIARKLEILPQSLNNIISGARGVSDDFLSRFLHSFDLSLSELLTDGEKAELFPELANTNNKKSSNTLAYTSQRTKENGSRIPLIPYDAIAGYGSFDFQDLPIEEYYTVGDFKGADFLIRVKGDSMYPKYSNGDVVACKIVEGLTFWQWHKIYAICTQTQGVLIKRIEPDEVNPAFIQCISENPSYKPFYVHQDELVSIALVMGAVVLE